MACKSHKSKIDNVERNDNYDTNDDSVEKTEYVFVKPPSFVGRDPSQLHVTFRRPWNWV